MPRTCRAAAIALFLTFLPIASWAQMTGSADYDRGVRLYDDGKYEAAGREFERAYESNAGELKFLFAMAQAKRRQWLQAAEHDDPGADALCERAIQHFTKYVDARGPRADDAKGLIDALRGKLRKPEVKQAEDKTLVTLNVEPGGAREGTEVFVDDQQVDWTVGQLVSRNAQHKFRAQRRGFTTDEKIRSFAKEQGLVALTLTPLPARLVVIGAPQNVGAEIWIEQKHVANIQKEPTVFELEHGTNDVFIRKRGADPVHAFVNVERGETRELPVKQLPRSTTRVVSYGMFATGTASVLFGAVSVGLAISAENDAIATHAKINDRQSTSQEEATRADARLGHRGDWTVAAGTGFGVGVAAFALGAALYWFDLPDPPPSPLRPDRTFARRMKVSPTGTGLVIRGDF